ncbi:unnamed protein product [Spirodela intermedia]|uniref:F-box domain-containing protein n=1 Tax=Spirodela intermedia TaxID=51605 RepID=A0A7I8J7S2_SPIIN|nr:unnamed protein product [Spirodela intermedia]CAA6666286.1 unnamed protein product [Spirodela intermedia]
MDPLIPGLPDDVARACLTRVPYPGFRAVRSVCKQWREELESPAFHELRRGGGLNRTLVALAQSEQPSSAASRPVPPPGGAGPDRPPLCRLRQGHILLARPLRAPLRQVELPPPVPGSRLPIFSQITAAGRELVVLGGWDPATWIATNKVFIYDLASGVWRVGSRMPGPRRSFFACAAAPDGRTVYIAGGHDEEKNSLRSAIAYNVETDSWSPLPDMSTERDECGGVFRRGTFLVVGGYSTEMQGHFGKSSEAFDPATGRWGPVEEGTLGDAGVSPKGVVAGADGRLFRSAEGHVEVLEEAAMAWRKVAELPDSGDGKKAVAPSLVAWPGPRTSLPSSGPPAMAAPPRSTHWRWIWGGEGPPTMGSRAGTPGRLHRPCPDGLLLGDLIRRRHLLLPTTAIAPDYQSGGSSVQTRRRSRCRRTSPSLRLPLLRISRARPRPDRGESIFLSRNLV